MASAAKKTAKAVPTKKPAAPAVLVKSEDEGASTYRVTGCIRYHGTVLRPADPDSGRKADTVELTDQQAYALRGFIEPAEPDASETATPTE